MMAAATRRVVQGLGDALVSLRRGWRSSLLSLAAIVSAVFVLGAFLALSRAVDAAITGWAQAAELSVFLRDDADAAAIVAVRRALDTDPTVRATIVVSPADAAGRFARDFPDLAPLVAAGGELALPTSVEARLAPGADARAVAALASRVRRLAGVDDVRVDQELLARLASATRAARALGGGLAAMLLLAAAMAVASVVRLSYVARIDEVEVLLLVGAPLGAIRAPFALEGAVQGALGTAIALAALRVAWSAAGLSEGAAIAGVRIAFLPAWWVAGLVAGGAAVGAAAGLAAVAARQERVKE